MPDFPELDSPPQPSARAEDGGDETFAPPPPTGAAPRREPLRKYVVLFVLTLVTATLAGADFYAGFQFNFGNPLSKPTVWSAVVNGLWYSVTALLILSAHEFGHYFACRYYGVASSLPYYIPFWLPIAFPQFGTLGAVIRIRQPVQRKYELFDIGIAGPLAGFAVIVPALVLGLGLSRVVPMPGNTARVEFGEPLLFQAASWLLVGPIPTGYGLNLHPIGWAAWFGLLATALNLAPIGQLDGGHISYAVLGRKSVFVSVVFASALVVLSVTSGGSYALWTMIVIAMLLLFGPHHPRALDEEEPIDRARLWLAVFAAAIFALSFTPVPMEFVGF